MIDLTACRFLGLDLDGVFARDIPWEQYLADMEGTLAYRDTLPVLPTLPSFDPRRTVIITGRPDTEFARTRAWLDRHGFGEAMLKCRPPLEHGGTMPQMARYKATVVNMLGCSDFFESEREQAEVIAAIARKTAVYHWDAETALAQRISIDLGQQIDAPIPARRVLNFEIEAT